MQTTSSDIRELLNKKLNTLDDLKAEQMSLKGRLLLAREEVVHTAEALVVMQKAAKMSQDHLAAHLSNITTQAIQAVIRKPYEFVCEFVERRGSTEADLYLVKDGEQLDILSGTGGGLADVCSLALKVAYLLLSNVDRVLIMDEISRHVNDPRQRQEFAEVLERLSREFGIQMIINTTVPELLGVADKVIRLEQVDGVTREVQS